MIKSPSKLFSSSFERKLKQMVVRVHKFSLIAKPLVPLFLVHHKWKWLACLGWVKAFQWVLYTSSFQLCIKVGIEEYLLLGINRRLQSCCQIFRGAGNKDQWPGLLFARTICPAEIPEKSICSVPNFTGSTTIVPLPETALAITNVNSFLIFSLPHISLCGKTNPVGISPPQRDF